jgi:hypothetical protein
MKQTKTTSGSVVPDFNNVFNADTAMINYRWSGSSQAPTALDGNIMSDFIACDLSDGKEHTVRIKNGMLHGSGTNASIVYFTSNANSTAIGMLANAATPTDEGDGVYAYKLGEGVTNYQNTKYIRCCAIQSKNDVKVVPQTLENAKQIIITIDEPITYTEKPETTETYYEWVDTGITYTPTFKTDLIGVLGEGNVVYLSDNLPSGTYTLKYGDDTYETIGIITV